MQAWRTLSTRSVKPPQPAAVQQLSVRGSKAAVAARVIAWSSLDMTRACLYAGPVTDTLEDAFRRVEALCVWKTELAAMCFERECLPIRSKTRTVMGVSSA